MLDVEARDGAARLAQLTLGERRLTTPTLFWLADRLPVGAEAWQPQLGRPGNAAATLINTFRFTQPTFPPSSGQLVLARQLEPTHSMLQGGVLLRQVGDDLAVFPHSLDAFHNPKVFAPALIRARREATHRRALYAPGLGEPSHLALLAYAGVDLFDAVALHYAAAHGRYLTESGHALAKDLPESGCPCPACQADAPSSMTEAELATHNQYAARTELATVRNAIRQGRLRELVEARARSDPELTALLRRLDAQFDYFEERSPLTRSTTLHANTKESLNRVECRRFRQRLVDRYQPPTSPPVLLLFPCSARKPYSTSRTHRAFGDALWRAGAAGLVHEVVLTSPLGLVPRELELTYPAAHYDVPVTGEWDEEEGTMIRTLLHTLLAKRSYARVVAHLPRHTYDLVQGDLPADTLVTCTEENPTSAAALQSLERTTRELSASLRRTNLSQLLLERLRALATYQFGPAAATTLFRDATAAGKWPVGKVLAQGEQLAMLPPGRGLLSLTLAGARRLLEAGAYRVEIEDFQVKGSIFGVGVRNADPEIRPGDEVVLHHEGALRGVGVAQQSAREMLDLKRGEAVKMRHHA